MTKTKWTKEYTYLLVSNSKSIAQVITASGATLSGGMHRLVTKRIAEYNLDTSHFKGQAWSKGKTSETDSRIKKVPDIEIFIQNGTLNVSLVRKRYKKISVYECTICKTEPMWHSHPLTLQLDHINGIPSDHRLLNLRWLCPNCHSQTATYGSKNRNPIQKIKPIKLDRTLDRPNTRKVIRPSKNELADLISSESIVSIGKKFGVSDNAVRKWAKRYNLKI